MTELATTALRGALANVDTAAAARRISQGTVKNLKRWLTEPHYAIYAPRILGLLDAEKYDELDALFWEVIAFGTGGRRGPMSEFGSATINERTIAESADGLAAYLKKTKGTTGGRAVVAYDTRHRSREFAQLTATTLAAHGLTVFCFESHRSTPELSFAVRHLSCDVGAMISASHNPPADNGFKAYWNTGGQILSPHDEGIIDCVYHSGEIPTLDFEQAVRDGRIQIIGAEIDRAFLDAVLQHSLSGERHLSAVFTPLHGVGETSAYRVLQEAGFHGVRIYEPHRPADGSFPNVPDHLPNPERPQVFAPVIDFAESIGADLVLACDPDADRLGVAAKTRDGGFQHLTGNQVGALLADYVVRKRSERGTLTPKHYLVETLVTSPLLGAIGRAAGIRVFDELLVGFKYIAQTMDREGPELFVFGAEESLGYLAGQYCRDKDATIAALYVAELAAELHQQRQTLWDRLDELYVQHGYYTEGQTSKVCQGPRGKEQIDALLTAFSKTPPQQLAGIRFSRVRDYRRHEVRRLPENSKSDDLQQPDGNLLIFEAEARDCKITFAVRPSGTEPKIKFYFFAQAGCKDERTLADVKSRTNAKLLQFQGALSNWVQTILTAS